MTSAAKATIGVLLGMSLLASGCASKKAPLGEAAPAEQPASAAGPMAESPRQDASPQRFGSLQEELAATAGDRVYFELDSSNLTAEARGVLERQADWLRAHPAVSVLVAGNCDERGTREYNLALGARRAQAAFDYLAGLGVPRERMKTISYGKERPIDGGANETAWARNRNAHTIVG